MYGVQFEYQRGFEFSIMGLVGRAVHSLIPVADNDRKVFIRAGGK